MEKETLNFLDKQLHDLSNKFKDAIFKIEYNNRAEVYFVEVFPDSLLSDENFVQEILRITTEFLDDEYKGMLSFVNSESLYKIKEPIKTIKYENLIICHSEKIKYVEKEIMETGFFVKSIDEELNMYNDPVSFIKDSYKDNAIAA